MKKTYAIVGILGALAWAGTARGSVNVDSAANYGGGWTNGSNGGGGFGAWSIEANAGSGWAGNGIWASSNAFLNLGEAFGFVARGESAYVNLDRSFSQALAAGDSRVYDFPVGAAGTHWMHAHTLQEQNLLAAPLIVRDPSSGEQEIVVLLHDFSFTPAAELLAMHARNCGLGLSGAAHFDEAEALGAASVALHHDLGALHCAEGAKSLLEIAIAEGIGQVAHVQFVAHEGLLKKHKKRWRPTQSANP